MVVLKEEIKDINLKRRFDSNKPRTSLDEVELCLGLATVEYKDLIKGQDYLTISQILNEKYDINCKHADITLLYEPTIEDMEEDLIAHFSAMELI